VESQTKVTKLSIGVGEITPIASPAKTGHDVATRRSLPEIIPLATFTASVPSLQVTDVLKGLRSRPVNFTVRLS